MCQRKSEDIGSFPSIKCRQLNYLERGVQRNNDFTINLELQRQETQDRREKIIPTVVLNPAQVPNPTDQNISMFLLRQQPKSSTLPSCGIVHDSFKAQNTLSLTYSFAVRPESRLLERVMNFLLQPAPVRRRAT